MAGKKPQAQIRESSITFTTTEKIKSGIVAYAAALGMTRKVNGQDAVVGDVSKGVNILLDFALRHIDDVEKWRAEQIALVLKGDD